MGTLPTLAHVGHEVGLGRLRILGLQMRVWWAKDRLTQDLAAGAAPIDSRELALRAGQLTAKKTRQVVASSIEDLLQEVNRPTPLVSARVPIQRGKVMTVREQLVELADRISSPEPVRAHGMALALLLLTDTGRPLFGSGTEKELSNAIMEARARLDAPTMEDTW